MRWILSLFLLGCAPVALEVKPEGTASVAPNGAEWVWHKRPVRLMIDEQMPPTCILSMLDAVQFWRNLGVDYLEVRGLDMSEFNNIDILAIQTELPPETLGLTRVLVFGVEPAVAELSLGTHPLSCIANTAAHELGHALGLPHNPRPGTLMYPAEEGGGLQVDANEIAWVTQ